MSQVAPVAGEILELAIRLVDRQLRTIDECAHTVFHPPEVIFNFPEWCHQVHGRGLLRECGASPFSTAEVEHIMLDWLNQHPTEATVSAVSASINDTTTTATAASLVPDSVAVASEPITYCTIGSSVWCDIGVLYARMPWLAQAMDGLFIDLTTLHLASTALKWMPGFTSLLDDSSGGGVLAGGATRRNSVADAAITQHNASSPRVA